MVNRFATRAAPPRGPANSLQPVTPQDAVALPAAARRVDATGCTASALQALVPA